MNSLLLLRQGVVHALAAAIVLVASPAFAAHPLATDDTGTQGAGHVELEIGFQRASGDDVRISELGAQLTVGLGSNVDVLVRPAGLQVSAGESGTARGLGDTDIGIKWRFAEFEPVSFALRADAIVPTGDEARGLGEVGTVYRLLLVATAELDAWALHANAGYTRAPGDGDARRSLGFLSGAAVWSLNDATRFSLELTGTSLPERDTGRWAVGSRIGAIVNVTPALKLDAGYERRINGLGPVSIVLAGVTYRW